MMIIGHKAQQKKLKVLYKKNCMPHAFLFSGPENLGKRFIALWFLKMINCEGKSAPCFNCRSCYEIEEKIHPDVLQITSEEKEIKIKQVQEVAEKISYKAVKAKFKGILIDDAHLMNHQAQNALLKTIEEPTPNTLIILVTSYPYILLPTILSRVFEMKFYFVSEKEVAEKIKNKDIAKISFGRPGRAVSYLNFPEKLKEAEKTKKEVRDVLEKDLSSRFLKIKKIIDEERGEEFLNYLLEILEEKIANGIKEKKDLGTHINIVKEIEKTIFFSVKTNINLRLALEKIIIKI
jgi:DNA polymerase III subunit delta'